MIIKTDHKWKPFKYRNEVPEKVLAGQFGYLDDDSGFDGFFRYRGGWYHLSDFMIVPDSALFQGWSGYSSESFFSGVLLRVSPDGERYMTGTYYS